MTRFQLVLTAVPVALLVAASCALLAAPASAQTYTVHSCETPTGGYARVGDWHIKFGDSSASRYGSSCPRSSFWVWMLGTSAHKWDDYIDITYTAPSDTEIREYHFWRSVQLAPDYDYRYVEKSTYGSVVFDPCYGTCAALGVPTEPLADANRVGGGGKTGLTSLRVLLTCALPSGSCPAQDPGARFQMHRADITLLDRSSPVFAAPPSGPLVEPGRALTGVELVSLSATDRGGGIYQAMFEVDGQIVQSATLDTNGGLCKEPFIASLPCKLSASGTLGLDTTKLRDGTHSLRIMVTDVTGTNRAVWGPVSIRTANAACNPDPRVTTEQMTAKIVTRRGKRARRTTTTKYGKRVRVRGQLETPQGAPVAGAPVCIGERTALANATVEPGRTLVTDADGRFSTKLSTGPSRRVYFVHRVGGGAVVSSVAVKVRAPVRLRASRRSLRNGQRVILKGRLRGYPRARRGVLVEMQAKRTDGWQTFGTTRTKKRGKFRLGYRFTRTSGVQRYRLRARVPKQSIHPFAAGNSKPVIIRVKG